MKVNPKNLLLLTGVLITSQIFGQIEKPVYPDYDNTSHTYFDERRPNTKITSDDRAADDIIWSDNFDDPALWIPEGPSDDYFMNGWSIDNTLTGWYFGETEDMGTEGNFARFVNGDPNLGEQIDDGPFTLTYSGVIDLTGIPAPHLEFDQYGTRYFTIQAVEISTNDGLSWVRVGDNSDQFPTTATATNIYPKPMHVRHNIAEEISEDPSNVMVRLFWDGMPPNYVDYGWFVDNIRIVEGHSYDCEMNKSYFRSGVGGFFNGGLTYYQIAQSQLSPVHFSGEIGNNGDLSLNNVELIANISYDGGDAMLVSDPTDFEPNESDSLWGTSSFTPTILGAHELSWTFLGDDEDTYTANNELLDEFIVTEYIYARDNGQEMNGVRNFASNVGNPFQIGNVMEIFNVGTIGGMHIKIDDHPQHIGQEIFGEIQLLDESTGNWEFLGRTEDHEITVESDGTNIVLTLMEPASVEEGDILLVLAGHYGNAVRDVTFSLAQEVQGETVMGYNGGGDLITLDNPNAVMVRLDFRDLASTNETDKALTNLVGQNYPNPFAELTRINYTMEKQGNVSFGINDLTGKEIWTEELGSKDKGQHELVFSDVKLSPGCYYYKFIFENYSITKKMIVK